MHRAPRLICTATFLLLVALSLRADTLGLNTPSLVTDLTNTNLDARGQLGTSATPTTRPAPTTAPYQAPSLLTPTLPFPLVSLPPSTQPSRR